MMDDELFPDLYQLKRLLYLLRDSVGKLMLQLLFCRHVAVSARSLKWRAFETLAPSVAQTSYTPREPYIFMV
jgi:hypothetical protein